MKRNLVLVLGLVLASTSVFATRARLESLGEDKDGSFFIEDGRNIFLNAAHVNHVKDSLVFEGGSQANFDSQQSSDAEGGFFKSHGEFTYGVYFGRQADGIQRIRAIDANGGSSSTFLANENNIDLYFGGDAQGIEWGAALSYSNSDVESTNQDQSALALRLGVVAGATEAWANISLLNEADGTALSANDEYEGDIGIQLGVSHSFGHGYRAYAQYVSSGADHTLAGVQNESDFREYTIGLGKTKALNDNANMFSKIEYVQTDFEFGNNDLLNNKEINVVVGVEADVKEWLTVRASVNQNLWGDRELGNSGNNDTTRESTRVAGGLTVKIADLAVDASASQNTQDGNTNDTLYRLGATYNF